MGDWKGEETAGGSLPAIASPGLPTLPVRSVFQGPKLKHYLPLCDLRGARDYLLPWKAKAQECSSPKIKSSILRA